MGAWYPLPRPGDVRSPHWPVISLSRNEYRASMEKIKPKKCKYCGKTYTPTKAAQIYCSDRCRQRAHRERKSDDRKKALRAYRERTPKPRRLYDNEISATDPRSRLTKLRAHGLLTPEYWALYAEVDKQFNGGNGTVNGISTTDPYFVDAVLFRMDLDGRIVCETQEKKKDDI